METEMEFEDRSPWHHLVFVEELVNDADEESLCSVCKQPALGPVYKCLECEFLQHKSCPEPTATTDFEDEHKSCSERTDTTDSEDEHDRSERHHLIFIEEVDNEKEEVVCLGCEDPLFAPAYKCSVPNCPFFLHQSCTQLPLVIQHLLLPDDILVLRAPSMKFKRRSPWHHLVFVEELVNDADEEALCSLCKQPALGPVYKCLECRFLQHKSCPGPTTTKDLRYGHPISERHHLIFIEEVDNEKEEVVCMGCKDPAIAPAYKCSVPRCPFFLHQSCTQLPLATQHTILPDDILVLRTPSITYSCNVCHEPCIRSLFYRNFSHDFDLDIRCVFLWRSNAISAENCHKHLYFPTVEPIHFSCRACGKESQGIAHICSICRVMVHESCAGFRPTIITKVHSHRLSRTYSVHRVTKNGRIFCRLCRKHVNTKYGAYYCKECDYIAHMKCASRFKSSFLVADDFTSHLVYLVEDMNVKEEERIGPQEIKHFSHSEHALILIHEEPIPVKCCETCLQVIIFNPFYGCMLCNFFLHSRCSKLPRTLHQGQFHDHLLTLHSQQPFRDSFFCCGGCNCCRHDFLYKCDKCLYEFDIQCCLIPEIVQHHLDEHTLLLAIVEWRNCNNCGEKGRKGFECIECDFNLCLRCIILPPLDKHRYDDKYLLKLHIPCGDDFEENYCLICEKERDPRDYFYYCIERDFAAHFYCVVGKHPFNKLGRSFMNKGSHEHPLAIVEESEHLPPCKSCGESFVTDRRLKLDDADNVAFKCTQCEFIRHFRCQLYQQ